MKSACDVAIIGAGHNGLAAAAYLSRAGLRVVVLEKRNILGGCCITEEVFPGYRVSTLAYVCSLLDARVIRELELERHGYKILLRNPSSFTPLPDGRSLLLGPDAALNHREISKLSRRDAEAYPRYEAMLERIAAFVEPLFHETPVDPRSGRLRDLWAWFRIVSRARRLGSHLFDLARLMTVSVRELLDDWFETAALKGTLSTDGILGTVQGPSSPGTGYLLLHHVMGSVEGHRGVWGYVEGGMGAISRAMADDAREHGAILREGCPVRHVVVNDDSVGGVVLESGEEIAARVVASCADPAVTFLKLVPLGTLPDDFLAAVKRYKFDSASMKINLALAELPDFRALPGRSPGPQHRGTIHICPDMDYIERACMDALGGEPSAEPIIEACIPTVYDSTLAPPGRHLLSLYVQYAPYRLASGSWDEARKETFADRCVKLLGEYAPNLPGAVLYRQVISPLDLEREWGLTGGNVFHGRMSLDQVFFLRPVPGYANYRTPLSGLYLCGSGAHPGGGVTGLPGRNAAREILRDSR